MVAFKRRSHAGAIPPGFTVSVGKLTQGRFGSVAQTFTGRHTMKCCHVRFIGLLAGASGLSCE